MPTFKPGLVHAPVTPFTSRRRIDFDAFEKLIEFHLRNGAEALALPMHAGESVSLSDSEQQALLEFSIKRVNGRVPVIAHVSDSGTAIAASRAGRAEAAGAAAVVMTTPYYWTPPPSMILEHFAQTGAAVRIPFLVHYTPEEMGGAKLSTELVLKLVDRLDNFAGLVDSSLDWQFMINIVSSAQRVRPEFQLLAGMEYMISAGAIGATGVFSSLAGVAPKLVRGLYDLCREERYSDARRTQEDVAALRQLVKIGGVGGLKAAVRAMGRDCGKPRPPNEPLRSADYKKLAAALDDMAALKAEPRGW